MRTDENKCKCLLLQLYGDVATIKKMDETNGDGGHWCEDQSVAQHILVEGSPGIGKTMFNGSFVANGQRARCYKIGIVLMLQLVVRE